MSRKPNMSAAVSAQRVAPRDGLDDFPTPPWGARAWVHKVVGAKALKGCSLWEPAANRGHLLRGLKPYFGEIHASDIFDYGAGYQVFDFLSLDDSLRMTTAPVDGLVDWIVTNPPFNKLSEFISVAERHARVGIAMFCRSQAMEGVARYNAIYEPHADRYVFSQFCERISLVPGCLDREADRPAAYGWLTIWKERRRPSFLLARRHIPACRAELETDGDYPFVAENQPPLFTESVEKDERISA